MTEQEKIQKSNQIGESYKHWDREVVAELTRKFLFNHRAFYLNIIGEMPSHFEMSRLEDASSGVTSVTHTMRPENRQPS